MLIRVALFTIMASYAPAQDWPQFLGPARNGVYSGNDLAAKWGPAGPAVVWKKEVGPAGARWVDARVADDAALARWGIAAGNAGTLPGGS